MSVMRFSAGSQHPVITGAAILTSVGALVGLSFSLYGYLAPLTGITGSFGALLVCVASCALLLDAVALWFVRSRRARIFWFVLGFLGGISTLAAAYFLHAWYLMVAMAAVLLGLAIFAAGHIHHSRCEVTT